MNKDNVVALFAIAIAALIGYGLALASSSGPVMTVSGVSVVYLCVALAFIIQIIAFVPAFALRTEKFYDLTGSLTYLSVTAFALGSTWPADIRSATIAIFIGIWALRLGYFLFRRVMQAGHDTRFENVKKSFLRFLMTWMLQGLWVTFSCIAGITAIAAVNRRETDTFFFAGAALWLTGYCIEAIADAQKKQFRSKPENKGKFIAQGLWALSRHPNYFGEIVLWTGIAVMAFPVLQGWQLIALSSPFFVTLLLTKISGIPLLEEAADKRWGGNTEYEKYKRETPVLVINPFR